MYPKIKNVIYVTFSFLMVQFFIALLSIRVRNSAYSEWVSSYSLLGLSSISCLLFSFYAMNRSQINFKELFIIKVNSFKFLFASLLIAFALHIVGAFLSSLILRKSALSQEVITSFVTNAPKENIRENMIFLYFISIILAPIAEEIFFRGFIFWGLLKNYSFGISLFVSSILFAFVHMNPSQMADAILIGLFSGFVLYRSKNILFSILVHLTYNALVFALPFLILNFGLHNEDYFHLKVGWYTIDLIDFSGLFSILIGLPLFLKFDKDLKDEFISHETSRSYLKNI
ncbi:CPBP family intramembrane glutamic endopeptidase [Leptospira alstonii]|uniref:CPBP family intramembrane glutamic endopeptidase n=1 Tax=Leptospira alstonii TaxID=28452 RepID=UPI000772FB39|nr:CPBP family intramembrane glutamic endopeptidase [Leptospira alstonii]